MNAAAIMLACAVALLLAVAVGLVLGSIASRPSQPVDVRELIECGAAIRVRGARQSG